MPTPPTQDPTLPLLAEIASLKSALAAVQDAYTQSSLGLTAMQRVKRVERDNEATAIQPVNGETRWGHLEID